MHNNATTALQTNSRSRVGRARQATEARTSLPAPRRRRLRHPLTLGRPRTRARGVGLRRDGPEPECGCSSDGVDQRRQLRPFTAEQLMRPARLGAPPRVHHKDPVVVDNRVQPVCNGRAGCGRRPRGRWTRWPRPAAARMARGAWPGRSTEADARPRTSLPRLPPPGRRDRPAGTARSHADPPPRAQPRARRQSGRPAGRLNAGRRPGRASDPGSQSPARESRAPVASRGGAGRPRPGSRARLPTPPAEIEPRPK
eukprot:scaffold859_cov132-Isochrysis_galbana.AAC.2